MTAAVLAAAAVFAVAPSPVRAQVLFQQFTYPVDKPANGVSWWTQATAELPRLARLGVYATWHPVPTKGGSGAQSMGYDPYDLYDLGSKDQKGTIPTRFGTKDEYLRFVAVAHASGLRVYSDVVLNHAGGADGVQTNDLMAQLGMNDIQDLSKIAPSYFPPHYAPQTMTVRGWTLYTPQGADGKPGTGRFGRDRRHFHPSAIHPDRTPPYNNPEFGEDYCYEAENNYVARQMTQWGQWFRAQTGVDGFRMDAVKLMPPSFLNGWANAVGAAPAPSTGDPFFYVGEFWDTNRDLLASFQDGTRNRMSLFDFGLFYALWDMTDKPNSFSMRDLLSRRNTDRDRTVMFVSNHDIDRFQPINRQKRALPYAITMVMAGRPSIFYSDYFKPEDAALPATLERLVDVQNRFAVGREIVRLVDDSALVIEREKNLLGCFNSGGKDGAAGRTVTIPTAFGPNVALRPVGAAPEDKTPSVITDSEGRATVTIPPGGFVLLVRADATDKTNPDRFARKPLATTQVWELADDLDTGHIGDGAGRSIYLTAAAGSIITATLTGTTGTGTVSLSLSTPTQGSIKQSFGRRGRALSLHSAVGTSGTYTLSVNATGHSTPARLSVTYTAPTVLP